MNELTVVFRRTPDGGIDVEVNGVGWKFLSGEDPDQWSDLGFEILNEIEKRTIPS
jgi:hypothetical protein